MGLLGGGAYVWYNRWHISRRVIEIADPSVRAWATREVSRLSDGAYQFTASHIKVDEARRRVAIDTMTVTTDSAANGRRKVPLPALTLRFRTCAFEGIDLTRLASGHGLHATRGGCDSMSVEGEVVAQQVDSSSAGVRDTNNFLKLRANLDLPSALPVIQIDTMEFPFVEFSLGITAANKRQTSIAFDRLAIRMDSLHYDAHQTMAQRGLLLSRNVTVTIDRFEGNRGGSASRMTLNHLDASLADGTAHLDGLVYAPMDTHLVDSLGFTTLRVGRADVAGVDWRAFLTNGDVRVGEFRVDTAFVGIAPRHATSGHEPSAGSGITVERALRALGRSVRLDSLLLSTLTLVEAGAPHTDSVVTTLSHLALSNVSFTDMAQDWTGPYPIGHVTLAADGVVRRSGINRVSLAKLRVDVPAQTVTAENFRAGPEGDDSAFAQKYRFRKARLVVAATHINATGADLLEFMHHGSYAVRRTELDGLSLDVYSDKKMPDGPTKNHRTPQGWLKDLGALITADTIVANGRAVYRERDDQAQIPGVLAFDGLHVTLLNFSTDPAHMSAARPLHLVGDSRLMGAGAMHMEFDVPLLSPTFALTWRASLGGMDAPSFNGFLVDATGMRFTSGKLEQMRLDATVVNGRMRGMLYPRWTNLHVDLPGVARGQTGLMAGLKRGVAKIAANTFVIRGDNVDVNGTPAINGPIDHTWIPSETLPQYLWFALRDPLLGILKRR